MLVFIAVAWWAGLMLRSSVPDTWRLPLAVVALVLATLLTMLGRQVRARLWVVFFGWVAALAGLSVDVQHLPKEVPRGLARIEGRVERVRVFESGAQVALVTHYGKRGGERIEDDQPLPLDARLRLWMDMPNTRMNASSSTTLTTSTAMVAPGDHIVCLAKLRPPDVFFNPSPAVVWPRRPVDAVGRMVGMPRVRTRAPWHVPVEALRQPIRAALVRSLPPDIVGVVRALVLGEANAVSKKDRAAFRRAGIAHFLAVSGFHVMWVVGLCLWIVHRLAITCNALYPHRVVAIVGIPLVWFYAIFAGGAPSAFRAAATVSLALMVVAWHRRPHGLSILAGAFLLLTIPNPAAATEPGLLMSVVATSALVTGLTRQTQTPSAQITKLTNTRTCTTITTACRAAFASVFASAFKSAFSATWRATLATLPLTWICFQNVPVYGLLTHVFLLPACALLILPLAHVHTFFATTLSSMPFLSDWSAHGLTLVVRALLNACHVVSQLPAPTELPPLTTVQAVTLVGIVVTWLALRRRSLRHRLTILLVGLGIFVAAEWHLRTSHPKNGMLRVTFFDVGQGDATFLELPDGTTLLIDAGGAGGMNSMGNMNSHSNRSTHGDPGTHVLLPYLKATRQMMSGIDIVVLTHPHPDHYGGLYALADHVPIGELWDNGQAAYEDPEGNAAFLLQALRKKGTQIHLPNTLCNTPRRFGNVRVDVLFPCPAYQPGFDLNDNSIVVRVSFGAHHLLFTGDIEALAEQTLTDLTENPTDSTQSTPVNLRADVLKVPHHGSRTSSSAEFLRAVQPQWAVISAGRNNRYGHPHIETRQHLQQVGAQIFRTDQHGGIVVESDGTHLNITTTVPVSE